MFVWDGFGKLTAAVSVRRGEAMVPLRKVKAIRVSKRAAGGHVGVGGGALALVC